MMGVKLVEMLDLSTDLHTVAGKTADLCIWLLPLAPGATDRGGDLLHDEEVQVQAHDPDPGEALQV